LIILAVITRAVEFLPVASGIFSVPTNIAVLPRAVYVMVLYPITLVMEKANLTARTVPFSLVPVLYCGPFTSYVNPKYFLSHRIKYLDECTEY
jgi:hypothetical protein